jgi:hypothetical protein
MLSQLLEEWNSINASINKIINRPQ